ncbi:fumarylacetoacetate hydrolase family protein [Sinosporangium siamense]|uniref:Fumarylacetoacetate hydrolase n=1 Tax=Sinosporangium siamense TaxID=1367973 RepID=A0A919RJX8_9ACTN|nr:fumarylacetoacetate hydrolase family protein [Sinosporangium siamense]GII95197.1 fumarylacetoacetate hydrolase [Sinosporangium siamense]
MRIANLAGRLTLITSGGAVDVARASGGRFSADPQAVYAQFDEFRLWAEEAALPPGEEFDPALLGAPAPAPRQLFAVGLNYRAHAAEAGFAVPDSPAVFTKFVTSITGPHSKITLPEGNVDWEVELVAVIGRTAHRVAESTAWAHVAGLTVGQDLSERVMQMAGPAPQFSLAKSYPGFTPMGPWLVTVDEFADPDDLELSCAVDGEVVQRGRTSDLVFSVPGLVARLSAVTPLLPGDVIFTGTPAGVGVSRTPPRFLRPGEVLTSAVEGVGEMRHVLCGGELSTDR